MARINDYIKKTTSRKDVRLFVKIASHLLKGCEKCASLKREEQLRLNIALTEQSSEAAVKAASLVLYLALTGMRTREKTEWNIDLYEILHGYAYYKCGCEVCGFTANFDGVFDIERCYYLVKEYIQDIQKSGGEIRFKIDLSKFTVLMDVQYSELCDDCAAMPGRVAWFKENMRPDSLLQGSIYSHGLATGFGVNEVSSEKAEDNLKKFLCLSEEKEICCSWKTQQIGGFGLFVRGEVTIASNKDLWSYIGYTGNRDFNVDENYEYLIDRKEDLDLTVWDHTEFFVKPKEVIAFWAKDWFVRDIPGGRELVEKLQGWGYKVYITRRRHR